MDAKSPTQRADRNFTMRFTQEEYRRLDEEAIRQNVNVCDLIRSELYKAAFMQAPAKKDA